MDVHRIRINYCILFEKHRQAELQYAPKGAAPIKIARQTSPRANYKMRKQTKCKWEANLRARTQKTSLRNRCRHGRSSSRRHIVMASAPFYPCLPFSNNVEMYFGCGGPSRDSNELNFIYSDNTVQRSCKTQRGNCSDLQNCTSYITTRHTQNEKADAMLVHWIFARRTSS
jgi:hypothetical protein